MTTTPRWEWRTFGGQLRNAEPGFASLEPVDTQHSHELYLLTPEGANVKIRDGLLDIKTLLEVDADGLERWAPVLKRPFPLSSEDVATTFAALGVAAPPVTRPAFTMDQFLDELVEPNATVQRVSVHKSRDRYAVAGCSAESTRVAVEGRETRTIAVESEDGAAVRGAIRELGFSGYRNINYLRGLRRTLGAEPDRYAVIDVGTNSVKLHLGERGDDASWTTLVDRAEVTRLGEGLGEHGVIAPEALERTADAVADMVDEADRHDALAVVAVGTAALRSAGNGADAIAAIRRRARVTVEVIPGEEESRLSYRAVQAGLPLGQGSLVVFDTGGGSTEFTFGEGTRVLDRFSLDVGAVRFAERFRLDRAASPAVLADAVAAISADLTALEGRGQPDDLVGMGGTITNLTAVSLSLTSYDPDAVQGAVLERDEIERQIELYRSRDAEARRSITGLQPKRSEVILAGACIVATVMDELSRESLIVSDRGLRHGLMIDRFGATPTG